MKRRLVTSALPYVNNVPHLGNLIQVLSADVFAKFCRLAGYETLYVCGTDEYGTATETRALEEGVSPSALCDRYHALHTAIYSWFGISFDKWGRTSTPLQTEITQYIFTKLEENGYILEKTLEQLFCNKCSRFLADRYVLGTCPHCGYESARGDQCESCGKLLDPIELLNPRCSSCSDTPAPRSTSHLYIDLPKIRPILEAWIAKASKEGFWANNAIQMTQAWIRDGLRERAITRDLKWGIPVPKKGYEDKVFYVWFDAPIGYISITANLAADKGLDWKEFIDYWWKSPDEVELFQFIGKDNIPFHTVVFPSSLLGSGDAWTMLHHMSSTEYLNYESGKFSKSRGVGVFGSDAMASGIAADVWRFYIFYNRPEKSDALFTWKDFQEKVNGELIGNLGNLVNRTLSFAHRYFNATVGPVTEEQKQSDFWQEVHKIEAEIKERFERAELREAFKLVFELSSIGNKAFQDGEPWKTRITNPTAASSLVNDLCYLLKDIAILMYPYMSASACKLASFLNIHLEGEASLTWNDLGSIEGLNTINTPEVLFNKLEDELVSSLREQFSGSQTERAQREQQSSALSSTVASGSTEVLENKILEDPALIFAKKLDVRVARIASIERHPKADKLYIEKLETAEGERVIVSGLVPYYSEEELLGKKILVAWNLKPAKLRGVESHGMLLAASMKNEDGSECVEVLDAGDAPLGARLLIDIEQDCTQIPEQIDIDTFFSVPITVQNSVVGIAGKPLVLNGSEIRTTAVENGEVG